MSMVDQQKPRSSLTVQAFWLLMAKTVAFIFAFALPVLLTRSLSQSEYGLFKQVFLIITTATALLPLGFGMSAYYYFPRENDAGRRGQVILNILLFNFIMGVAACLLLIIWPGFIARFSEIQQSFLTRLRRSRNTPLVVFILSGNCSCRQPGVTTCHDLYCCRATYQNDLVTRRRNHFRYGPGAGVR